LNFNLNDGLPLHWHAMALSAPWQWQFEARLELASKVQVLQTVVLEKSSQAHHQMTLVHFRSLWFKAPAITLYVPVLQFPQAMHSLSRTVLGTGRRSVRVGFFNFKLNFKLERDSGLPSLARIGQY